jgi:transcriptional regulator with XRE-family HTH domain
MERIEIETLPMTHDEKSFFKTFGKKIAELRKEQGLTQSQLAELLGLTQQQVGHFEVARRRVPGSMLPTLARTLGTSVEELLGEDKKPGKRGPAPKLQRHLERIQQLPKARQRFVLEMLDTALQHDGR